MIIDSAKGVEEQTRKLFHVCKMRGIPIFTFINKMDRAGKDPFELVEEIEKVLGIQSYPMNWPIRIGGSFLGVYNRKLSQVELFNARSWQSIVASTIKKWMKVFTDLLGEDAHKSLQRYYAAGYGRR